MNEESSLDESSRDRRLTLLYRYWNERRDARRFPARTDINPAEFRYALGRVSMIEVHYAPLRFLYRLVSTRLTAHLGYEMTGKFVDDIPEIEMRQFTRAFYERALDHRAPLHEAGSVLIGVHAWWHETLVLPLSSDGERIDMLMIYRNTLPPVTVSPGYRPL